jgi:hypothetical protein
MSSRVGPCSPLAGGLCKFYVNAGGKRPIQCQTLLVQYKHRANHTFIDAQLYSMINSNDKIKQLTLLSQRKLVITGKNIYMAL